MKEVRYRELPAELREADYYTLNMQLKMGSRGVVDARNRVLLENNKSMEVHSVLFTVFLTEYRIISRCLFSHHYNNLHDTPVSTWTLV